MKDILLAAILLLALAVMVWTYFVPVRLPLQGRAATRVSVFFHRGGFIAVPMVSGAAYQVLEATLDAVAAAAGTTIPAILDELPLNQSEQIWALQRVSVTSPTLVTGNGTNSGTINIRQVRQNALASTPVSAAGSGYTSAPTVTIAPPTNSAGQPLQAGQRQATAVATISAGAVNAINITDPGAGYTAAPVVTLSGGGGSGAACASPTVGQVVVGTIATLALVAGVNLPAEAPVTIPQGAALNSPLMAGDILDVQYVQIGTGLALPAGTNVKAEVA